MQAEKLETVRAGELVSSTDFISPAMRVDQVADQLFTAQRLEAVALVEKGEACGLATRNKILAILFRRFGFELYGRDPIISIAERKPLIVSAFEPLDSVLEKAMLRPPADIYDEIIVTDEHGSYLGLLSVRGMVVAQGDALSQSLMHREVALAKAREMQKVSDIKSQFIAHVTHELRAPTNVVLGLAELMKDKVRSGDYAELGQHLALMAAGATSLRSIITNILDLSKIEAGKMEVINESCALIPLLDEVADMTRVLLADRPVTVQVQVTSEQPYIVSDYVKLRQILVNFSSNAAKFTKTGSITLRLEDCLKGVRLCVEDTGVGIREADLERLFVAFSQLEDAKTRHVDGTGLGLTITRQLVELLGGIIKVTSILGKGSIFSVELPREPQVKEIRA